MDKPRQLSPAWKTWGKARLYPRIIHRHCGKHDLVYQLVESIFNISPSFPHFYYPPINGLVGRAFEREKLSTVIPVGFALCGLRKHQKNLCPIYPRAITLYPPGYPRIYPPGEKAVEKLVEKKWITLKKGPH